MHVVHCIEYQRKGKKVSFSSKKVIYWKKGEGDMKKPRISETEKLVLLYHMVILFVILFGSDYRRTNPDFFHMPTRYARRYDQNSVWSKSLMSFKKSEELPFITAFKYRIFCISSCDAYVSPSRIAFSTNSIRSKRLMSSASSPPSTINEIATSISSIFAPEAN